MAGTKAVKISDGVYQALREMAARAGTDISTTASFFILALILQTDAHLSLSPPVQAALAADVFDFLAVVMREEAMKLRTGRLTWEDLSKVLEELKK